MAILPQHKPYLAIRTAAGIFADHCNPFGLSSAAGILGEAVDAAVDIIKAMLLIAIFKWVDDIISTRTPIAGNGVDADFEYSFRVRDVTQILESLGFKISYIKVTDFANTCVYHGFKWDIALKRVWLPDEKREKYLLRVLGALEPHARVTLKDAEKLRGCLVHICFVFLDGRSRLPSLHRFVASFKDNRFSRRFPPAMVLSDLRWWKIALEDASYSRSLSALPLLDLDLWVDASTSWGVALIAGSSFQAWELSPGWDSGGQHIGWAECIGLELAMTYAASVGARDARVLVHTDNSGAIGQFLKGRSRNVEINVSIRRTEECCRSANLVITPIYVKSEDNRADAASRGMPQPDLLLLRPPLQLPGALSSVFVNE